MSLPAEVTKTYLRATADGKLLAFNDSLGERRLATFRHGTVQEIHGGGNATAWFIVRRDVPDGNDGLIRRWQLYTTDGTRSGTTRVASFRRFAGFVEGGDESVTFRVGDGNRFSRWTSDGTRAGTTSTRERAPLPEPQAQMGSTRFFTYGSQIWKSDGTAAGTSVVANLDAGLRSNIGALYANDQEVFFLLTVVRKSGVVKRSTSLWVTDGSPCGTTWLAGGFFKVTNAEIQDDGTFKVQAVPYFDVAGTWISDGTAAGTRRL